MSGEQGSEAESEIDCGDERTVHMLYAKLGRPALGKTLNLVGSGVAEEIVQEVFAKLWTKKLKFPNLRSAYAWVYKACTNAAIDHLRGSGNSHLSLGDLEHAVPTGEDFEKQAQAREAWQKLVVELNDDEASLFVYRTIEGLSQDEVAEVMKISRRTVNRLQEKLDSKLEKIRRRRHVG